MQSYLIPNLFFPLFSVPAPFFIPSSDLRSMRKRVGENGPWNQVPQINTKSNATTYQVTGLVPFTVYSFRTRAVNKLGISPPSKESYYIVSLREGKISFARRKTNRNKNQTKQKPYFCLPPAHTEYCFVYDWVLNYAVQTILIQTISTRAHTASPLNHYYYYYYTIYVTTTTIAQSGPKWQQIANI